jgi:hypothetical protein
MFVDNEVSFYTTLHRLATGRSDAQRSRIPHSHPRQSSIYGLPSLKWLLLQGDAAGLISQRKSPGVRIQGLVSGN